MRKVYLDYSATTPVKEEALERNDSLLYGKIRKPVNVPMI